jgi:hypothetical protein
MDRNTIDRNSEQYIAQVNELSEQSYGVFRIPKGSSAVVLHTVRVSGRIDVNGNTIRSVKRLTTDRRATSVQRDYRWSGREADVDAILRALGNRIKAIQHSGRDGSSDYYSVVLGA